jgi:hypothetical protein
MMIDGELYVGSLNSGSICGPEVRECKAWVMRGAQVDVRTDGRTENETDAGRCCDLLCPEFLLKRPTRSRGTRPLPTQYVTYLQTEM